MVELHRPAPDRLKLASSPGPAACHCTDRAPLCGTGALLRLARLPTSHQDQHDARVSPEYANSLAYSGRTVRTPWLLASPQTQLVRRFTKRLASIHRVNRCPFGRVDAKGAL